MATGSLLRALSDHGEDDTDDTDAPVRSLNVAARGRGGQEAEVLGSVATREKEVRSRRKRQPKNATAVCGPNGAARESGRPEAEIVEVSSSPELEAGSLGKRTTRNDSVSPTPLNLKRSKVITCQRLACKSIN